MHDETGGPVRPSVRARSTTTTMASKKQQRLKKDYEYDQVVDRSAWYPYQHACGYESQARVEEIETRFRQNIDTMLTFWVKAEPEKDDTPEDDLAPYEMKFRHNAAVIDVVSAIRQQEGIPEHEPLQVIFCDVTLDEGKTLAHYRALIEKERANWPYPFVGVLWIAVEGHRPPKDRKVGAEAEHPGYYSSTTAAANIFGARRKSVVQ